MKCMMPTPRASKRHLHACSNAKQGTDRKNADKETLTQRDDRITLCISEG